MVGISAVAALSAALLCLFFLPHFALQIIDIQSSVKVSLQEFEVSQPNEMRLKSTGLVGCNC